jgi:hypothetical protein
MSKFLSLALIASSLILLSACGGGEDDGNALMRPGENCLQCHANFVVAGTVYPSATSAAGAGIAGVSVVVTDAKDVVTTMTSNAAGNFWGSSAITLPLKSAYVVRNGTRTDMLGAPGAGCSTCHNQPPASLAPGRLFAN